MKFAEIRVTWMPTAEPRVTKRKRGHQDSPVGGNHGLPLGLRIQRIIEASAAGRPGLLQSTAPTTREASLSTLASP